MPELPEVETCRRGIEPHLLNQTVSQVIVRNYNMRWPVSDDITELEGLTINSITRRAKYLLLATEKGTLLLHLGMSGTLRVLPKQAAVNKHDHFDLVFANDKILRLNDPRRFGAVLWLTGDVSQHPLLVKQGPEPLSADFDGDYLYQKSRNKTVAIKTFIMNNLIVVGVGNIYANESLFKAGIKPTLAAGKLSKKRCQNLADEIKLVLEKAIEQGGTTLKDFTQADGKPGYFAQSLAVYGRKNLPCITCQTPLKEIKQSGRATTFCPQCQAR
ncbi:bifunctional DNA-formamidopyrimidine glycosylase/DNA-(apurinic or apyrimidinic site) lyase [Thalassotalea ponticola]|uniref:bifunctional DNA-formamidopyrimidine glycosylase/DNA-(apurinic or apyrimidinic site) lyase n=1 Tax=Thalassotalea ponticola TaxID=1523392 RepID=UPI0025B3F0E6|nr:bifunctional DNA-formamidopyrimidine glycosylase/DNA-(apurinic or apyrimidinic site) lyase [Thalassotalea ponticola]MDN3652800.1 bifunctional DNA-formamidopyrimidine glycosylase/DNA-(apurinic or apyrimidinic site) lyase [Thalassotalea ponticola]